MKIDPSRPLYWNGHRIIPDKISKFSDGWVRVDGKKFEFTGPKGVRYSYATMFFMFNSPESNYGWEGYDAHILTNGGPGGDALHDLRVAVTNARREGWTVSCTISKSEEHVL